MTKSCALVSERPPRVRHDVPDLRPHLLGVVARQAGADVGTQQSPAQARILPMALEQHTNDGTHRFFVLNHRGLQHIRHRLPVRLQQPTRQRHQN